MTDYILDLFRLMLAGIPIYVLLRILLLQRRARRFGEKAGVTKVKLRYNKLREFLLGLFAVFMMALLVFVWQGESPSVSNDPELLPRFWISGRSLWHQRDWQRSHVCAVGIWTGTPLEKEPEFRTTTFIFRIASHSHRMLTAVHWPPGGR